jgi:hypothetical protein
MRLVPMKPCAVILLSVPACCLSQSIPTRILDKPVKYQRPVWNIDLSPSGSRVENVAWRVYSDRANAFSYVGSSSSQKHSYLDLLDWFYAVEERDDWIHIVKDMKTATLMLSVEARDYGWIPKKNALLWERSLISEEGEVPKRAMVVLEPNSLVSP